MRKGVERFELQLTSQTQGPVQQAGPPYPPRTAGLGGIPQIIPDVPVTGVFLLLYVTFFAIHLTIFTNNNARGHKFLFSGALCGE
jgi:hypothetical protein